MFEKVSQSLKYDSNFFFVHKHVYLPTYGHHITPVIISVGDYVYKLCTVGTVHMITTDTMVYSEKLINST